MTSYLRRKRVPTRDINLGVPVVSTTGVSSLKSLAIWRGVVFVAFIVGMMVMGNVAWADLDEGLVAHYPFNGNANDESGNGNDGTVNGATLTGDQFGNADSAYSFNGVDNFIEVPNHPSLKLSSTVTAAAWIRFNSLPSTRVGYPNLILDKVNNYWLGITQDGKATFLIYQGGFKGVIGTSILEAGIWYHVTGIYDGNTLSISVNGSGDGSVDMEGNMGTYDGSLFIGDYTNNQYSVDGTIDDIRIYNRALSVDEVKELYELDEPNPVTCSDGPATYSNETRQAILPCVEIPLYTDINGSPINITGLYSAVLEIPFGFSDFEAKELTFLEIIDESNPTHARFNPDTGILDIPRIDVPTTVPLLVGGTIPGPVLQCSAKLQQSALRAEVLMLQEFDCNLP